jgi:hypothetical protein
MTEWTRFPIPVRCGFCGATLAPHSPVRVTHIATVKRDFVRCEDCVGDAPADVPDHEPAPRPARVDGSVLLKDAGAGWMPYRE